LPAAVYQYCVRFAMKVPSRTGRRASGADHRIANRA
jgi:hypothetical protein